MTAQELKKKYIDFFVKRGHRKLPNVSLVPEDDPTTLFISAGMQPLVPYLLGEPHPLGKRLVSLQRCLRTGDIEEVGNVFHNTFFEMLGNWSLGDYWKKESLSWSYEFLTKILDLNPRRFHVTVFKGDKNAPKDIESEKIWLSLGIPQERIYPLPKKDNWWEAGETGPGGPDSEIFYDIGKPTCGPNCRPGDGCGRFFEMWNNVFMEYNRKSRGNYERLRQKNVDTGMGVERTTAVLEGKDDIYQTELFSPIIQIIEELSQKKYQDQEGKSQSTFRIIADHLRAAVFVIADGVVPSNVEQGYILRRLIRRAIWSGNSLGVTHSFLSRVAAKVINSYEEAYPEIKKNEDRIYQELSSEEKRFMEVLSPQKLEKHKAGLERIAQQKLTPTERALGTADYAFGSLASRGIPAEMTFDEAQKLGLIVTDEQEKKAWQRFERNVKEHQKISRAGLEKKFAGGLADHTREVTKLHTATHLLHRTLRDVLGKHVKQVGSNITAERLRFDFTHPGKLTEAEIKRIEELVNKQIKADLPVKMEMMTLAQAKKKGALAFFAGRYGKKVKVYSIGDYSCEVCGGPHVRSTGEIGGVKIVKEKPVGAGRRRVYARLA